MNNPRTLVKNSIVNFGSQILIVVLAILLVPLIVRALGDAKYGLLSLAFVAFGSLGLLELGLGRATTKFVSAGLARNDLPGAARAVWTSLGVQLALGCVFALCGWLLAPSISGWLNLPRALQAEGVLVFQVLAMATPVILAIAVLRGTLEGCQRFDLVSYVKVFTNGSLYIIPLVLGLSGYSVGEIVIGLVVVRVAIMILLFWLCNVVLPGFMTFSKIDIPLLKEMLKYSSWAGFSNLLVPFLVQLERIFISVWAGVEQLAYYAISYEIINGLWVIPGSIAAVLFPAFSASAAQGGAQSAELFKRPIRYLLILLAPICILVSIFSYEILSLWQGKIIAGQASMALSILAIGVLINSLGWIPSNLFFGYNRPDLPTKNQLIQLPIYVIACYLFIPRFGILGAATAFVIRNIFETTFNYYLARRLFSFTKDAFALPAIINSLLLNVLFAITLIGLKVFLFSFSIYVGVLITCLGFSFLAWNFILDRKEKNIAMNVVRLKRN